MRTGLMSSRNQPRVERRGAELNILGRGGAGSERGHLEVGVIQLSWLQGVRSHVDSPVAWVHDVVVDDAEVAVERLRLILVLDHSWL